MWYIFPVSCSFFPQAHNKIMENNTDQNITLWIQPDFCFPYGLPLCCRVASSGYSYLFCSKTILFFPIPLSISILVQNHFQNHSFPFLPCHPDCACFPCQEQVLILSHNCLLWYIRSCCCTSWTVTSSAMPIHKLPDGTDWLTNIRVFRQLISCRASAL